MEERLRHVLEIRWRKLHKRVHLVSRHLFRHKTIIYCQLHLKEKLPRVFKNADLDFPPEESHFRQRERL